MEDKNNVLEKIKGRLVISCQALPDEPLHSSFIMGRMAKAAMLAGAAGIRANSVEDIQEIKKNVHLPIIGIVKSVSEGSDVFITPTMKEIGALHSEGTDIIAMDATKRVRPDGKTIKEVFPEIRKTYPDQLFMADCSTYEEAMTAADLGFDCVGTTLTGYTEYTYGHEFPDLDMIKKLVDNSKVPVIAEGGIWSPDQLKKIFDLEVHAAVVGSAITRPLEIAKRFMSTVPNQ